MNSDNEHIIGRLAETSLQDLSAEEMARMQNHAARCQNCQRAFDSALIAAALLRERAALTVEPSEFFEARVMANVRASAQAASGSRNTAGWFSWRELFAARRAWQLPMTATAVLILFVTGFFWLRPAPVDQQLVKDLQTPAPTIRQTDTQTDMAARQGGHDSAPDDALTEQAEMQKRPAVVRRPRPAVAESVTEFYPLTALADSAALESGQVIRVRLPRTALVSLGLPMNVERAGELVRADVVIGDDGLAHAIRFVQ